MKELFMGLTLAVFTSAAALSQTPPPPPETEYTIKLRQSEIDTLFLGMTKVAMPYERTAPFLQDVSSQIQEQEKANKEKAAAATAESEKTKDK